MSLRITLQKLCEVKRSVYKTISLSFLSNSSGEDYNAEFKRSVQDPVGFWGEQAKAIHWHKPYDSVLVNKESPSARWFSGGQLNVCYNAVDRHVEQGRGDQLALIHDSPITQSVKKLTYKEVLEQVSRLAGALKNQGVGVGDRVLIYMPMIPEAVIGMLACARIGAVHVVVFGGFAAKELSVRIKHTNPKAILTASAGIEPKKVTPYPPILEEAIALSGCSPKAMFVYQRKHADKCKLVPGRDYDWNEQVNTNAPISPVPVDSNHPLYIIHTSGTTATPKGVVRPTGGYAVVLPWTFKAIYAVQQGQAWWAASDLGWVVGHSYICYGPLLAGLTSVIYEGKPVGTPDSYQFFRVLHDHNVKSMFVAPTAIRAIRQADPHIQNPYKLDNLRCIFSAGEKLDYETQIWGEKTFKKPILDHWWQTESGWSITAVCSGYKNAELSHPKDSSGKSVPGYDIRILDEQGKVLPAGQLGRIAVKLPLPPGFCSTFWENDERYQNTYFQQFKGYYDTMDAGYVDEEGHVMVMGRMDDVINVAGHRLSTGALEEAVLTHPSVVDCAVVPLEDSLKGHVPVAICVLSAGSSGCEDELRLDVIGRVRHEVGAVAALQRVVIVPKLPKTRSGKIARSTLAAMANNQPFKMPLTIEDASVYPLIKKCMQKHGLALTAPDPQ